MALEELELPESLTVIGASAFEGCGKLTKVNLPNSLTRIANRAFRGCGLLSVSLPESWLAIGEESFDEGVLKASRGGESV